MEDNNSATDPSVDVSNESTYTHECRVCREYEIIPVIDGILTKDVSFPICDACLDKLGKLIKHYNP